MSSDKWIMQGRRKSDAPILHVISDSLGKLGSDLARAVASVFGDPDPAIEILSEVSEVSMLDAELSECLEKHRNHFVDGRKFVVFYTLVVPELRAFMKRFVEENEDVRCVDLLDTAIDALRDVTGAEPAPKRGAYRALNDRYFRRIDAVEFSIAHDDGQSPQDLPDADIVIVGVSRTSKTPTSIYLGQQGYRVANVPLVPGIAPPEELYEVESSRIFGLMTTPEVLSGIRGTRMGTLVGSATSYADIGLVREELLHARTVMQRLGCVIINTENRAIEETAQEIMRRYNETFVEWKRPMLY